MGFNPPIANDKCNQGYYTPLPIPATATGPTNPAVHSNIPCASRRASAAEQFAYTEPFGTPIDVVIEFLPNAIPGASNYTSTFDYLDQYGVGNSQVTIFELPAGSGEFFLCMRSVVRGRGFPNEHKCCLCVRAFVGSGHTTI